MKKILSILLVSLFACSGNAQTIDINRVHSNAISYLLKHLDNPYSYRAVSWNKIVKIYTNFDDSDEAKHINDVISNYESFNEKLDIQLNSYSDKTNPNYISYDSLKTKNIQSIQELKNARIVATQRYKPTFKGYYIEHTFRARNKFNALIIRRYGFDLDKKLNVTDYTDLDELHKQRQEISDKIEALK